MGNSLTPTLSGTSSVLEAYYFPPIELSAQKNYIFGFVELLTFNSIPNIDKGDNKFYTGDHMVTIPTGSYEIGDIEEFVMKSLAVHDIALTLKPNNSTLKSELKCSSPVDLTRLDSTGRLLGFTPQILTVYANHVSNPPVTILKINSPQVECNITMGAYVNEGRVHTIHEFFPTVPPGYKIAEVPSCIIYLPIAVQVIDHIQLKILDQDGNLLNFRGEVITIRLRIKS